MSSIPPILKAGLAAHPISKEPSNPKSTQLLDAFHSSGVLIRDIATSGEEHEALDINQQPPSERYPLKMVRPSTLIHRHWEQIEYDNTSFGIFIAPDVETLASFKSQVHSNQIPYIIRNCQSTNITDPEQIKHRIIEEQSSIKGCKPHSSTLSLADKLHEMYARKHGKIEDLETTDLVLEILNQFQKENPAKRMISLSEFEPYLPKYPLYLQRILSNAFLSKKIDSRSIEETKADISLIKALKHHKWENTQLSFCYTMNWLDAEGNLSFDSNGQPIVRKDLKEGLTSLKEFKEKTNWPDERSWELFITKFNEQFPDCNPSEISYGSIDAVLTALNHEQKSRNLYQKDKKSTSLKKDTTHQYTKIGLNEVLSVPQKKDILGIKFTPGMSKHNFEKAFRFYHFMLQEGFQLDFFSYHLQSEGSSIEGPFTYEEIELKYRTEKDFSDNQSLVKIDWSFDY
jgi:hypothetical protein